jgi:hypothetical protein
VHPSCQTLGVARIEPALHTSQKSSHTAEELLLIEATEMSNQVNISLTEDEALVLFEFFARFAEKNEFRMQSNAEFVAFMRVSGQLEKTLVAPLQNTYREQLKSAQERLAAGYEGLAPGVEETQ